MENYLAIERDEFMIHAATHMNLKITILSERSQRPPPHQKNGAHALSFHLCILTEKIALSYDVNKRKLQSNRDTLQLLQK